MHVWTIEHAMGKEVASTQPLTGIPMKTNPVPAANDKPDESGQATKEIHVNGCIDPLAQEAPKGGSASRNQPGYRAHVHCNNVGRCYDIQHFHNGAIVPKYEKKQLNSRTTLLQLSQSGVGENRASHLREFYDQQLLRCRKTFRFAERSPKPAQKRKDPAQWKTQKAVKKSQRVDLHRSSFRLSYL